MEKQHQPVPFLLAGETAEPSPPKLPPEGHYDADQQVWIGSDGEPIGYEMTRAGKESTWNSTGTEKLDTKGDHDDYD